MLLNTNTEMKWLEKTHLPYIPSYFIRWGAAEIVGNEGCPAAIRLYSRRYPDGDDVYLEYRPDHYGEYKLTDAGRVAALLAEQKVPIFSQQGA